jgi:hypothetical protein
VFAKVREKLSVNKQETQNFDVERFNLKKLNDMAFKELLASWNQKQVSNILILGPHCGHQWGMVKYCDNSTSPDNHVTQLHVQGTVISVLEVHAASTIMAGRLRSGGQPSEVLVTVLEEYMVL